MAHIANTVQELRNVYLTDTKRVACLFSQGLDQLFAQGEYDRSSASVLRDLLGYTSPALTQDFTQFVRHFHPPSSERGQHIAKATIDAARPRPRSWSLFLDRIITRLPKGEARLLFVSQEGDWFRHSAAADGRMLVTLLPKKSVWSEGEIRRILSATGRLCQADPVDRRLLAHIAQMVLTIAERPDQTPPYPAIDQLARHRVWSGEQLLALVSTLPRNDQAPHLVEQIKGLLVGSKMKPWICAVEAAKRWEIAPVVTTIPKGKIPSERARYLLDHASSLTDEQQLRLLQTAEIKESDGPLLHENRSTASASLLFRASRALKDQRLYDAAIARTTGKNSLLTTERAEAMHVLVHHTRDPLRWQHLASSSPVGFKQMSREAVLLKIECWLTMIEGGALELDKEGRTLDLELTAQIRKGSQEQVIDAFGRLWTLMAEQYNRIDLQMLPKKIYDVIKLSKEPYKQWAPPVGKAAEALFTRLKASDGDDKSALLDVYHQLIHTTYPDHLEALIDRFVSYWTLLAKEGDPNALYRIPGSLCFILTCPEGEGSDALWIDPLKAVCQTIMDREELGHNRSRIPLALCRYLDRTKSRPLALLALEQLIKTAAKEPQLWISILEWGGCSQQLLRAHERELIAQTIFHQIVPVACSGREPDLLHRLLFHLATKSWTEQLGEIHRQLAQITAPPLVRAQIDGYLICADLKALESPPKEAWMAYLRFVSSKAPNFKELTGLVDREAQLTWLAAVSTHALQVNPEAITSKQLATLFAQLDHIRCRPSQLASAKPGDFPSLLDSPQEPCAFHTAAQLHYQTAVCKIATDLPHIPGKMKEAIFEGGNTLGALKNVTNPASIPTLHRLATTLQGHLSTNLECKIPTHTGSFLPSKAIAHATARVIVLRNFYGGHRSGLIDHVINILMCGLTQLNLPTQQLLSVSDGKLEGCKQRAMREKLDLLLELIGAYRTELPPEDLGEAVLVWIKTILSLQKNDFARKPLKERMRGEFGKSLLPWQRLAICRQLETTVQQPLVAQSSSEASSSNGTT